LIRTRLAHEFVPAPNVEPRRNGGKVDMLILHYTGMQSAEAALQQLCSASSGVSCHYLINEDGFIIQMVGEDLRAWHAGVSCWRGETDTNSRSIGIEIQNPGHGPNYTDFPAAQMDAVAGLCRDILTRHDIPARHVLAHSDVAPGRKIDPGEKFDWKRLHEEGIGCWVPAAEEGISGLTDEGLAEFQRLLSDFGYDIQASGKADEQTRKVTDAFQRHFREELVNGVPDLSCLVTARRLISVISN
jgi:N-acetylmuramoyl-L-alanine amidase